MIQELLSLLFVKLNNVDVFSRKRVLGHKMKDITFDTYTDTVINKLFVEINKIKA